MPSSKIINELISEFHPRYLFPSLAAALVVASIHIVLAISFGALIFTGPLKEHIAVGISLMLLSTIIYATVFALFSKLKGMIGGLQDTAIAVLATISMSIVASNAILSSDQLLVTIVAMIALTSILSGILLLILGGLKLGRLVRYIPYPVIGGFIAGSGWLLSVGSISMLTDIPIAIDTIPLIFGSDQLIKWVPAVIFSILFYVINRKFDHYIIIPGMILAAIIAFYLYTGIGTENIEIAINRGLLFAPIDSNSFFQPVFFTELTSADFGVIFHNFTSICGVLVIGIITILLCVTGIEISMKRDLDLNYELRLSGLANLLAGLGGGVAGTPLLSATTLISKIHASTRLTGLLFASITAAVMFFGAGLITLIPKFVLGGLLLFIGISFLVEWLWDSIRKFSPPEYIIIVLIVGFIATIGYLEGVIIGVFLSVVYFVVRYSKISIIRHEIPGHQMRSTVHRPNEHWIKLDESDIKSSILKLQGFLFFGTSNNLLERIRILMDTNSKYIILDFQRVTGFDSSSALSFIKLMQVATERECLVLFCSLDNSTIKAFQNSGFDFADFDCLQVFDDLDHSLEWYEECVLEKVGVKKSDKTSTFLSELGKLGISQEEIETLLTYTEKCLVKENDKLIVQGEISRDLYCVVSGRLTVELQTKSGQTVRVATLNPGVFFGEMSYYLKQTRSANIVADEASELLLLSEEALARFEKEQPAIAVAFHTLMAISLSERLQHTDDTLRSMLM
jgi:sulfate permease, SulP family